MRRLATTPSLTVFFKYIPLIEVCLGQALLGGFQEVLSMDLPVLIILLSPSTNNGVNLGLKSGVWRGVVDLNQE
ncbi:hypothetical protein QE152_g13841 [Popillia japonica]|uniref:Uncharacterized protein n=1 Tax=Popillia japonica TaxID=7064 RepID=A0AAW1L8H6_POPJA